MASKYKKGYSDKKTIEYIKNNYDQFSLRVPKGEREKYKKLADEQGKSLNQLIIELLDEEGERVLRRNQINRIATYAQRINEKVATLSLKKNHYSEFAFGDIRIKFFTSPYITRYCNILKWDKEGYIEYTCRTSTTAEEVEDSIDLAYIAKRLNVPTEVFKSIEEVKIV